MTTIDNLIQQAKSCNDPDELRAIAESLREQSAWEEYETVLRKAVRIERETAESVS